MTQADVDAALEKQRKAVEDSIVNKTKVMTEAKAEQERLRDEREHKAR